MPCYNNSIDDGVLQVDLEGAQIEPCEHDGRDLILAPQEMGSDLSLIYFPSCDILQPRSLSQCVVSMPHVGAHEKAKKFDDRLRFITRRFKGSKTKIKAAGMFQSSLSQ
jgi:hypothetical protein